MNKRFEYRKNTEIYFDNDNSLDTEKAKNGCIHLVYILLFASYCHISFT